jgi:5,8-dihydroxy-2-naphthoate synthase
MKLTLGFSPCPNDTFIFDALVHGKIDTEGLAFDVLMADVEELNRLAFAQKLDVTKLSYHALACLLDRYVLLDAGSALGNNCGPLLIAKHPMNEQEIAKAKIAIPGKYTTANLLLSLAYPAAKNKIALLFSNIEDAVLSGEVDAGLIIHENRFTYMDKGLIKIMDLGEYWESTYKMPIPLGGIAIRRSIDVDIQQKFNRILRASVEYALKNPDASNDFVRQNAQEMEGYVIHGHIKLYVNDFTINLGTAGRSAIYKLFDAGRDKSAIPFYEEKIFLN